MILIDACLMDLAAYLGVQVEYARLRHDRDGVWLPARRTIRIKPGLHARHHRSVLAHEMAHAVHGDMPATDTITRGRQERRAQAWAALQLIEPDAYREAEELCEGHAGAMAVELGVMRSIVEAYQALLLRTETHTYLSPHMGTGQWAARVEVEP